MNKKELINEILGDYFLVNNFDLDTFDVFLDDLTSSNSKH